MTAGARESIDGSRSTTPLGSSEPEQPPTSSSTFEFAKKETQQVSLQRLLVIVALCVAALAISLVVYFVTSAAEDYEFEAHFKGGAEQIVASFEQIMQEKMGAVGSLCLALTAHGKATADAGETSWPWVTMDSFQERAASARILSKVLHMSLVPLVTKENRAAWEDYSVHNGQWYADGFAYQQALLENGFSVHGAGTGRRTREVVKEAINEGKISAMRGNDLNSFSRRELETNTTTETNSEEPNATDATTDKGEEFDLFIPRIYEFTQYWEIMFPSDDAAPFAPVWQSSPVTSLDGINLNLRSLPGGAESFDFSTENGKLVLGGFMTSSPGNTSSPDLYTAWFSELLSTYAGKPVPYNGDPIAEITYPIFADFDAEEREVVAVMKAQFSWQTYLKGLLPDNAPGYMVVLENACDGACTYLINGDDVEILGLGDLHEDQFSDMNISTYLLDDLVIQDGSRNGVKLSQQGCPYTLHVYPSQVLYDEYHSPMPVIITVCILSVFLLTSCTFFVYDRVVAKRQKVVVSTAKKSTDIIGNLFPEAIRDRLLDSETSIFLSPTQRVKSFLKGESEGSAKTKPIADLFPHTTVMFADIAGFTSWSSARDPSQVFILLQTVYQEFDRIARRRQVFKVETVGDAYLAVAGLPNPQPNHAIIMARFAFDCCQSLKEVLKGLEVSLGPDTYDLGMRFGLHSGAVTAGVLLGERARFQLFGDTVNTAARMESTGVKGKIQVSHATANLLTASGKGHWLERRQDAVLAKGKGVLSTYFVNPAKQNGEAEMGGSTNTTLPPTEIEMKAMRQERLIQWITDILMQRLKQVVVRRKTMPAGNLKSPPEQARGVLEGPAGSIPLDEVVEQIKLPDFAYNAAADEDPNLVAIPDAVSTQLYQHVAAIAAKYRDNPFHNFEHACHVALAATKLLGRIVSPEIDLDALKGKNARDAVASHLHDYTHGISDPLTLFGIVYSALIHDCDHGGVSNAQIMKEDEAMAEKFRGQSVAEQNSLEIAWDLLMLDSMTELRSYMFGEDNADMQRFRQVVVNVVLATDIFDKQLNDLRKTRWNKAFDENAATINESLRGTIVLEHIMQASDVAHTMQHWHVYQKWNRRLFLEMHAAFREGRMAVDPGTFWYKGELGFFDNYIIPLAKKLKDCGVFGVSSDECLTYALQNRAEWEDCGLAICEKLKKEVQMDVARDTQVDC